MPDGRILFTRWEYVDRDTRMFQGLWTMNPDGRGQMVLFGNSYSRLRGHSLLIDGLSLFTEKPVNENLGSIGMRRFVHKAQAAARGAGCSALLNIINGRDRSSRVYEFY